jgi:hypothetical protein
MTYGEAVQDTSTKLGAAAAQVAADRAKRIELAKTIATEQGITIEEALLNIWKEQ